MSMNKEFNLNLVLEVISLQSNNILTTFNWKEGIKNKYDSWSRIIPSKNILRGPYSKQNYTWENSPTLDQIRDQCHFCWIILLVAHLILEKSAWNEIFDGNLSYSLKIPWSSQLTSAKASTWCITIGLLQNSTNGLGFDKVSGRSLVPYPPTSIRAFILSI